VWDAVTGSELLSFRGHTDCVTGLAFSPDGKRIATAGWDNFAKVWNALSGQQLLVLSGHSQAVHAVKFSSDGKRLATASHDGTVKEWDAVSGAELLTLGGNGGSVFGVSFNSDNTLLASYGVDAEIKLRDTLSGRELLTLSSHAGSVLDMAFGVDGRVDVAGVGPRATIWDASSGQALLDVRLPSDNATRATFSSNGRWLATANADGIVQIYALDIRDLLEVARKRVTRNLTAEECKRYLQSEVCPLVH